MNVLIEVVVATTSGIVIHFANYVHLDLLSEMDIDWRGAHNHVEIFDAPDQN